MKKLLIMCLLALLIACEDDKEIKPNSTLQFETYLYPLITEEGKMNTVWVDFCLFNANDIEFAAQQDPALLKQRLALDIEGNTHYVCKTLNASSGTAHLYVEDGKYFMVLMLHETGKYSYTYIEIKNSELLNVTKVFTSALPENTFEKWD